MMNQMALDAITAASDLITAQLYKKRYVGLGSTRLMLVKLSQKLDKTCFGDGDGKDFYLNGITCDKDAQIVSFWYKINDQVLAEVEHNVMVGDTTKIDKISITVDLLAGEDDDIRTITGNMRDVHFDKLRTIFLRMSDLAIPFANMDDKISFVSGYLHGTASKAGTKVEIVY